MEGHSERRHIPSDFVIGMGTLTFGLVVGFSITAMPFLLSKAGVSVDRIAAISAMAMSPTFFTFLITPIVDVGFTRRTYALALALITAVSLGLALVLLSPARLPVFTSLLFFAVLCAVLQNNAVFGWMAEFVPDERRGRIGGWQNAANLGGGAAGSMLVMSFARSMTIETVGILMTGLVLVSALFLLWFPRPEIPKLGMTEIIGGTFRSVIRTSRQPNVLTGFLLFLLPAGSVAATNLFSGLGNDFAARPERVIWATGAGVALFSSLGALCWAALPCETEIDLPDLVPERRSSCGNVFPQPGFAAAHGNGSHRRRTHVQRNRRDMLCELFRSQPRTDGHRECDRRNAARPLRGVNQRGHCLYDLDRRAGLPALRRTRLVPGGRARRNTGVHGSDDLPPPTGAEKGGLRPIFRTSSSKK